MPQTDSTPKTARIDHLPTASYTEMERDEWRDKYNALCTDLGRAEVRLSVVQSLMTSMREHLRSDLPVVDNDALGEWGRGFNAGYRNARADADSWLTMIASQADLSLER